jgi:hypothetical protein
MKLQTYLLSPPVARRIAIVLAASVAVAVLALLAHAGNYATQAFVLMQYDHEGVIFHETRSFDVLSALVSTLGRVPAICTLVALYLIFRALGKQLPIPRARLSRVVAVACVFYVATGILAVIQQAPGVFRTLQSFTGQSLVAQAGAYLGVGLLGIMDLAFPFFEALAIYVVYLHLARLLTFEEEVA